MRLNGWRFVANVRVSLVLLKITKMILAVSRKLSAVDNVQEYERVGAVIKEDISEASVILGVKTVPIDLLEPYKTYAFFSHTFKGQGANMPLLDAILEKVASKLAFSCDLFL